MATANESDLHLRLPKELVDELQAVAQEQDRSVSYIVRAILRQWLAERSTASLESVPGRRQ